MTTKVTESEVEGRNGNKSIVIGYVR